MPSRRARLAALALGALSAAAPLAGCDTQAPPGPRAAGAPSASTAPAQAAPPPPRYIEVRADALPPGGEVREHVLYHTLRKGQTVSYLAERYLRLTDYYGVDELEGAILKRNRLRRGKALTVGDTIAIADLRRALPDPPPRPPEAAPGPEVRAIYVTASTAGTGRVFDLVRALKPLGLNTVVVDVKDSDGVVAYETDVALARATGADRDGLIRDLPKLMQRLRAEDVRVVARVAVFKDRWLARHARRLALKQANGDPYTEDGGLTWLDPSSEEVQNYAIELAREAVRRGFDEVQFDYVRFPVIGRVNHLRYEGRSRGLAKHEIITDFVAKAARAVHDAGRLVSIDVFGTVVWGEEADVNRTGQRIADLAPHVDVLCPMVYPSHFHPGFHGHRYPAWEPYYFVHEGLKKMAEQAAEKAPPRRPALRPWLQAFPYKALSHFNGQYIVDQLRGARDAGGFGFQLWDAKNDYGVGARGLALWREANAPPEGAGQSPPAPAPQESPPRHPVAAKAAEKAPLR
ncbi:MAG TPA: putative glycoside hydrolase [Polyangiaceae bacterium]|nr:putative glycoside hydrolase [Polyangiaceae bacterium]